MADTPTGETVTPEPLGTVTPPVTAPIVDTGDDAEQLKKALEQAQMRTRQLENEAQARAKADAEAKQKQLEDQAQFEALWKQSEAEKQALLDEREEADRKVALEAGTQDVLKDYPTSVQDIARTAGITLSADTVEARSALKVTLDALATKVPATSPTVTPNNPGVATPAKPDRESLVKRMKFGDKKAAKDAIGGLEALKVMRSQAGLVEPSAE